MASNYIVSSANSYQLNIYHCVIQQHFEILYWFGSADVCIYILMHAIPHLEESYTGIGKAAHELME